MRLLLLVNFAFRTTGRGRNGPFYRAAPRTDPSERNYRTGLLPQRIDNLMLGDDVRQFAPSVS